MEINKGVLQLMETHKTSSSITFDSNSVFIIVIGSTTAIIYKDQ